MIPLIELINDEKQLFIKYKCENNHEEKILLEEFIKNSKMNSIYKNKCKKCQKDFDIKKKFDFCSICNIFICTDCSSIHDIENEHKTLSIFGYDGCCLKHSNSFCYYCKKCSKNLCIYCAKEHKEHEILNLFELDENCINYIDKSIKEFIEKIEKIKNIKNEIIKKIDDYIYIKEKEIKFLLNINDTFKFEKKFNNLNYNIIKNIENIYSHFSKNNKENFQIIFDKCNNLISSFQKTEKKSNHLNKLFNVIHIEVSIG